MKKVVSLEMKNSICNWRFFAACFVIVCVALASTQDQLQQLLEVEQSPEGPGWLLAFLFLIYNSTVLMFIPLVVPFASAATAEEEIKSRFALFACIRSGRKQYFAGKSIALILTGGALVCVAMLILFIFACVRFHHIAWINGNEYNVQMFVGELILYFVRGFLNGAFWTLVGGIAAVATKNHYMAYAMPFVLYYVLFVFQERYYQTLFYLNPKYWATSLVYSSPVCIGILAVLLVLVTILFLIAMRRRMNF